MQSADRTLVDKMPMNETTQFAGDWGLRRLVRIHGVLPVYLHASQQIDDVDIGTTSNILRTRDRSSFECKIEEYREGRRLIRKSAHPIGTFPPSTDCPSLRPSPLQPATTYWKRFW